MPFIELKTESDVDARERYLVEHDEAQKAKNVFLATPGVLSEKKFVKIEAKVRRWDEDKVVARRHLVVGNVLSFPLPGRKVDISTPVG